MSFKHEHAYRRLANQVDMYIQRVFAITDRLELPEQDARKQMLNQMASSAGLAMTLLDMLGLLRSSTSDVAERVLRVTRHEHVEYAHMDLLRGAKIFVLVETPHHIARGIANIMRTVHPDRTGWTIRTAITELVDRSTDLSSDTLNALEVVGCLRDALRSNSVHYSSDGTDRIYRVHGITYAFRHGQRIDCDSWEHVLHALSVCLEIVGDVVASEQVGPVAFVPEFPSEGTLEIQRERNALNGQRK